MVRRALTTLGVLALAAVVVLTAAPGFVSDLPVSGFGQHVDADNPYRDTELTVGIDANGSRAFAPLVESAGAYWEENAERYADYPVNVSVVPDAADPDIRVHFVPKLDSCGSTSHPAGCSPKITRALQTIGVVNVRVLDDLSRNSTRRVLRHEFGHALGLGHDDAPRELMRARAPLTRLDDPAASERAIPWPDTHLAVAVDRSGVPDGEWPATDEQLADALGYYSRGANGSVPENVSIRRVANASAADITVRFAEPDACGANHASCSHATGTDVDDDGDLETRSGLTITLANVETRAVGWHVAHWLGRGLGLDDGALPPALASNASAATRRGAWWAS